MSARIAADEDVDIRENAPVPIDLIRVPARGPVVEAMVDRRTGQTWAARVEPFEIATTVVTVPDSGTRCLAS